MPVRIRLQRRGRTHYSEFAIVAADSRAPRDGKFIEKLGYYNPNTNPATIELNFDRALYWIQVGAQPSDTARAILSYKGVLMMDHLLRGVKKGAFDEEEAKRRFEEWKKQKEAKILAKKQKLTDEEKKRKQELLDAEKKINEERIKAINEKLAAEKAKEQEEEEEEAQKENEENTEAEETKEE
jgi:small subunit ribosomal protein S16